VLSGPQRSSSLHWLQAAIVESAGNSFPATGGRFSSIGADFGSSIIGSSRNTAATGLD
jgi:hypothetical protein